MLQHVVVGVHGLHHEALRQLFEQAIADRGGLGADKDGLHGVSRAGFSRERLRKRAVSRRGDGACTAPDRPALSFQA